MTTTKTTPVVCKDEDQVIAAAFDGVRRRPVVAINDEGNLVVCCRRTASKNGWKVEGVMYSRAHSAKISVGSVVEDAAPAPKSNGAVTVSRNKIRHAKEVVDSTLDDILGE